MIQLISARRGSTRFQSCAESVTEHQLAFLRRGRAYRAYVAVRHPSDVPPVHGAPSTAPAAVQHLELRCLNGAIPSGRCRAELEEAARRCALVAHHPGDPT